MRYKGSLEKASSGVPHTARFVEVNGRAVAVWLSKKQLFPPNPLRPRWCVVFGKPPALPLDFYFIAPDGIVREQARGRLDSPAVSVEEAKKVYAAFIKAMSEKEMQESPIIEAARAMFQSPKAGIAQLKEAVRAYEG